MEKLERSIVALFYKSAQESINKKEFIDGLGIVGKRKEKKLDLTLKEMVLRGMLAKNAKNKYYLKNKSRFFKAEVVRVRDKFGFIKDENGNEFFVPGHSLLGAINGDEVLARLTDRKSDSLHNDSSEIIDILRANEAVLSGIIVQDNHRLFVMPDSIGSYPLTIVKTGKNLLVPGDKVSFKIHKRGERHSEHTVDILETFGDSETAAVCVNAYISQNNISYEFSPEVVAEAEALNAKGFSDSEIAGRLDLRELDIFTIDGADTKDIDDAISIEKGEVSYRLGVHIADVSHYVKQGGIIDTEAFSRGTSIYFADKVIPMLPKALSNGICSLNPNEDRLAFSCLMEVGFDGILRNYAFHKTIIRSRVQGVYTEVNKLIAGSKSKKLAEKYAEVLPQIPIMNELAAVLEKNRKQRGAPEIVTVESKIKTDKNGVCIEVLPRESGVSQGIIEEFMLLANNAAASVAMKNQLPFVYRIHENPSEERLLNLAETLTVLGIDSKGINERSKAADLASVLEKTKESPLFPIVNSLVLRSMAKAKYSPEPVGHFGLVMAEYAHFTSPIRRYADLTIHRVLTDFATGASIDKIRKKYAKIAPSAANQATSTELRAISCERDCGAFYMAEYMKSHVGSEFDAIISGVSNNGFFVRLENTVEGMVPVSSLPRGIYEANGNISLTEKLSNTVYKIGDKVKVVCSSAAVNSGLINFHLPAAQEN